ncbi:putative membrane protein [Halomicrobium zhouii]|uniref:Putative membrane protein n=1 Tax=Halomicrobium zhouii TaxID=767519 RepID=A0A1I6KTB3_9EURY|nr:tripartite tricarboxylate transporter permease [Halomicrobium zhouii]SFR94268.1 putative membrane protein [Halomicrobium zhouii]
MLFPVRFVVSPEGSAAVLVAILAGVALGTASGLTPGLHANTFALGLAAVASSVPGPPTLVGATMLAAGTTHTFLDVVPALALGVPDPAMAASALPGHRLVIAGRGREAIRLSALGSGLAVVFAVPLAIPVTLAMQRAYPTIRAHLSLLLAGVAVLLVVTERTPSGKVGATLTLVASAALGFVTLDLTPQAPLPVGGMLAPLFAGLFGAPVLIESLGGGGVPPQDDATLAFSRRDVGALALLGTGAGAIVGYIPGVSAAIASAAALGVLSGSGPRAFVVTTSGVNTATAIFALFALVALGSPRTGVLVAVESAGIPIDLPVLLASVGFAAVVAAVLVPVLGDRYLDWARRANQNRLAIGILSLLVALSFLFAGFVGIGAFGVATVVGSIPARFGAKRANCMGVLLGPLALS